MHLATTAGEGGADRLGPRLVEVVAAASAAGFDAISATDHGWPHPIAGGPELSQVEAHSTQRFIAARTIRVRLPRPATAATYRPAGLLAKMVTTLDVLSGAAPCPASAPPITPRRPSRGTPPAQRHDYQPPGCP